MIVFTFLTCLTTISLSQSYQYVYRMQDGKYRIITSSDVRIDSSSIQFVQDEPEMDINTSRNIMRVGLDVLNDAPVTDNLLLSPTSITSCLDLLLLGAKGDTRQELSNLLGTANIISSWTSLSLGTKLKKLWTNSHVTSANAVFVDPGITIQPGFINISHITYQLSVVPTDFRDAINSTNVINSWVEEATNGTMKDLFQQPMSTDTRLVVINALYFKGDWEIPFTEEATKVNKFFVSATEVLDIPMMAIGARLEHYRTAGYSMIGLPYRGRTSSMYIVLPDSIGVEELQNVQKQMTVDVIDTILKNMVARDVTAIIPKFRVSTKFSLRERLERMGVVTMFDPIKANFGNMVVQNVSENIFPTDILHAVDLEVSERGTTAAAVTSAIFTKTAKVTFRVNRPFFFFIRHRDTGLVLFMGNVMRPQMVQTLVSKAP